MTVNEKIKAMRLGVSFRARLSDGREVALERSEKANIGEGWFCLCRELRRIVPSSEIAEIVE